MASVSNLESPLPGWEFDKARRVPINGIIHYELQIIRRADGCTVFDIGQSLESALVSVIVLAGKVE